MPTLTVSDHCLMLSTVMRGTNTMEIEKSEFFEGRLRAYVVWKVTGSSPFLPKPVHQHHLLISHQFTLLFWLFAKITYLNSTLEKKPKLIYIKQLV